MDELITWNSQIWEEPSTERLCLLFGAPETSIIHGWGDGKPSWRNCLEAEIGTYSLREPGWDGYAAKRIGDRAIQDAITFVRSLPEDLPPPLDQPCSDGEVSLVWRQGQRFAEVGFPGDGTFWWYCTNGDEEGSAEAVPVVKGIPPELCRLMGFPSEEGAQTADEPWGTIVVPERVERRTESSLAPSGAFHGVPTAVGWPPAFSTAA